MQFITSTMEISQSVTLSAKSAELMGGFPLGSRCFFFWKMRLQLYSLRNYCKGSLQE